MAREGALGVSLDSHELQELVYELGRELGLRWSRDEYGHDVVGGYERGDEQGVRGEGEELTALLQMCKAGSGESSPERIDGVVVRWP